MTFLPVITGKTDGEGPGLRRNIPVIRIETMGVKAFHAADGIRQFAPDHGVFMAVCDHKPEKFEQFPVFFQKAPVQPGDLVVLTVRIVVALLRIAEFVSGQEHGGAAAAHEYGTGVAYHPEAEL